MVSKIAVMALVAVVAVPILLGYGLNINTETKQVWAENNDPLNAKDYLQTTFDATGITYTDADFYQMNSNVFYRHMANYGQSPLRPLKVYPWYEHMTAVKTPVAITQVVRGQSDFNLPTTGGYTNGQFIVSGYGVDDVNYFVAQIKNDLGYVTITAEKIDYLVFEGTTAHYGYKNGQSYTFNNSSGARIYSVGNPTGYLTFSYAPNTTYADPAAGFRLNQDGAIWLPGVSDDRPSKSTYMQISQTTKSMLITVDLSTMTAPNAQFQMGPSKFIKTTMDGVVNWQFSVRELSGDYINYQDIYYNPLASSNTYQLYITAGNSGELRYIGNWPEKIGPAQSMLTYTFEPQPNIYFSPAEHFSGFSFTGPTPVIRIDAAKVGAYDYRMMEDAVYDPAVFRTNPETTLSKGLRFGQSIEFGGNTYNVTKGNITIGTHDFSLEGMQFESVQVGGLYENRINGNLISTTATPSTITFNGKWLVDVTTQSQSMETVSETKWEPGKFAWNGIDTDFKIAGLLASLGAFIGLAVYGRRSGTKVMPLLVVCGGAALMFLVMI